MEWTMSHDSCSCNNWTLVYFVLHHSPIFIFFPRAQTALRILLSQRCPLDPCAFSFMSPRTTQIWNSTVLNSRTPKPSWILFPAGDGEQEEVFCLPQVGYRSSDCPWPLFSALGWISSDCPGTLSISKFLSYSEVAMCLVFVNTSLTSSRIIYEPLSSQKRDLPTAFLLSFSTKRKRQANHGNVSKIF